MTLIFLNGGAMRGGPLHHQLQGAPLVRVALSAPKYRYYAVGDRFPAMREVAEGGVAVHGEVYDVALEVLRDHLIPAEPEELELGLIELDDGTAALATVLRTRFGGTSELTDISYWADWRAYTATRSAAPGVDVAEDDLKACLAVPRWVHAMLAGHPYPDAAALLAAARAAADDLTHDEIRAALAAHPRIGERANEPGRTADWSRSEQSGVDAGDSTIAARLRAANERYERRFGHIYLVCATGKDAERILADLDARLPNDPDAELDVVRTELREIALVRLERLSADGPGAITTHVLDAVTGAPAAGLAVRLERADGRALGAGVTDDDGRIAGIGPATVGAGTFRLRFDTDSYFAGRGRDSFYPEITVTFRITDPDRRHHVPILLSPFAYSTYRGS